MPRTLLRIAPLCLALAAAPSGAAPLAASVAEAAPQQAAPLSERALAAGLDRHPLWLRLGHYAPALGDGFLSRADAERFFLSPQGKRDPSAELTATLAALQAPVGEAPDEHARCRFPARAEWLAGALDLPPDAFPAPRCAKLDRWYEEIAPHAVTLVFAANYFNNPSSMFGHTLIRIDRAPAPGTAVAASPLASYAINFTADADADNPLVFTYKSFIGVYPGYFSLLPYHLKVKEYSDFESRDLWEYALDLPPAAVRRMVRHAWELDLVRFDYFFLDENCASQLLALIEVARPDLPLLADSRWLVIPSDTVRTLRAHGLVRAASYRPSRQTRIRHALAQVSPAGRDLALRLATELDTMPDGAQPDGATPGDATSGAGGPLAAIAALPAGEQADTVDAAYEYLQYHFTTHAQARQPAAARGLALLRERNRISAAGGAGAHAGSGAPPAPPRPDFGHPTASAGLAAGRARTRDGSGKDDAANFVDLRLRNGYHDFHDPLAGFAPGAKINFIDLTLRHLPGSGHTQIHDFRAIDVQTIAPRDRFFAERSWGASFGVTREVPRALQSSQAGVGGKLAVELRGGFGLAFGLAGLGTAFVQPEARLLHAGALPDPLTVAYGGRAGIQLDLPQRVRLLATSGTQRYDDLGGWSRRHQLDVSWAASPSLALHAGAIAERGDTLLRSETRLAVQVYF